MKSIFLQIFGQIVRVDYDDQFVETLISACYSAFVPASGIGQTPALTLIVRKSETGNHWTVDARDSSNRCDDVAELVYVIEKSMTIALQELRSELYFVHAAAIALDNSCTLIVGESGAGKSTLCWNLCNTGFVYMSDELAPVHPETLEVEPYPHAICLKRDTLGSFPLPRQTFTTAATMHVPVHLLPLPVARNPTKIGSIIFLTQGDDDNPPEIEDISKSEAAARLYANSLNQLAHEHEGLAAASRLVSSANCFRIERAGIREMREAVAELIRSQAAITVQ